MYTITLKSADSCASNLTEIATKPKQDFGIGDISIMNENDVVVEILGNNYFKIFKKRPLFTYTETSLSNFIALIQLSDERAFVRIKLKKSILTFTLIWYGLFLSLSAYLLLNEKFAGLIFILLMLIAPFLFFRERKRFKNFITYYINNL